MTDPRLEGVTLAERLTQGPIEPDEALDILEQLLESVAVVHDSGKMHGAISPEKIVLSRDGNATLTGFPAAGADEQPGGRTPKTAAYPAYLAPEQILDDPVGRRADLYSLGVVAYAMLTGKDPFGASEGVAGDNILYRILYRPSPRVPETALAGLAAGVGPAIDRAMSKEPQSRFPDAKSFLHALESEAAVVAAVPLAPARVSRRRWRPYALAGAVVIILLAIGMGVAYGGVFGGSTETTVAAIVTTSTTEQVAVVDDSTTTTTLAPATTTTTLATWSRGSWSASSTTTTTLSTTTETTLGPTTTTTRRVSTGTTARPASTTTTRASTTTTKAATTTTASTTTTLPPKITAGVTVNGYSTAFDGNVHAVTYSTSPPGLHCSVTYDGSSTPPSAVGTYTVVATVDSSNPDYKGSDTGTLTITP
jgi:serine/threonine protein kinase